MWFTIVRVYFFLITMLNSNINTNEKAISYKRNIHLWLVIAGRTVILKKFTPVGEIHIADMTIVGKDIKEVLNQAESYWNVLCPEDSLQLAYSYRCEENGEMIENFGYILNLNDNEELEDFVRSNRSMNFIDYSAFDEYLARTYRDESVNEAVYSLLAKLNV